MMMLKQYAGKAVLVGVMAAGLGAAQWATAGQTQNAGAGEHTVAVSAIPPAARKALMRLSGGQHIGQVTTEDGTFEGDWHQGGKLHEATVSKDGALLELEGQTANNLIPAAVKKAAKKMFAGKPALNIERQMVVRWTLEGKNGTEIVVKPNGQRLVNSEEKGQGDRAEQSDHAEHGEHSDYGDQDDHADQGEHGDSD